MKRYLKILIFSVGILGLACIRFFENSLFYDPLINFYNTNFQDKPFPDLNEWLYTLNIIFRFALNSIISLILIWIAFRKKSFIKFSILLYGILLIGGLIVFWFVAYDIKPKEYMTLFYIRRFLIHPILLIVLIPAFYFQKLNKKSV